MASDNQTEYSLKLLPPVFLVISTPDEAHSCRVDVYETWRLLNKAQEQPNEDKRWEVVRNWLAERLEVELDEVAESTARQVHETVVALGLEHQGKLKKSLGQIVSLPQLIQASPTTT